MLIIHINVDIVVVFHHILNVFVGFWIFLDETESRKLEISVERAVSERT